MFEFLSDWARSRGYGPGATEALIIAQAVLILVILSLLANFVARGILLRAIRHFV